MSQATLETNEQLSADVAALHRQLEERATRTKTSNSATDRQKGTEAPVLVIRGK